MDLTKKIFVAGHRGMVGSAIVRRLHELGYEHVITRSRDELDLTDQAAVAEFFRSVEVDQVYLAAAKVGGIYANNVYPADFIYENVMIETNIIHQAYKAGVDKLLFLCSSCIYPKFADQPIAETALLTGKLEPTNEPYAVAKITGIKLCESYNRQYGTDFRSVMPSNIYGPGDNYHSENSHVVPALLRRIHEAKQQGHGEVTVWGSGRPRREFLYVDDLAYAVIDIMSLPKEIYNANTEPMLSHINVGTGSDVTIAELADLMKQTVGYDGQVVFDASIPDGTPRKLLDVSKLNGLGIHATIPLDQGLQLAYRDFLESSPRM